MFQTAAKGTIQRLRFARAMQQAESKISHHDDPNGRRVISAIKRANRGKFTKAEQESFAAIEGRRQSLLSDKTSITTMDYGAGEIQSLLSKEEQEAGFEFHYSVSQIASASKPKVWARMLYEIINEFRPSHVVEMGTCVGISGSYMAHALRLYGGRLTTIEGSPTVCMLASETFQKLGYENVKLIQGRFSETLIPLLAKQSTEIVFVDGHHDGEATINYFSQMLPHLNRDSVVVFDDIIWSPSMVASWKHIIAHQRVAVSIDLSSMGIVVLN